MRRAARAGIKIGEWIDLLSAALTCHAVEIAVGIRIPLIAATPFTQKVLALLVALIRSFLAIWGSTSG